MALFNFKPGAELTFHSVARVCSEFYKILRDDKTRQINLDLSDVSHCDSAGMAFLIEARKLCKRNNKNFAITGMSAETLSLAEFCGVKDIL